MAQTNVGTRRTFQETSMAASGDQEAPQSNSLGSDHRLISESNKEFLASNSIESCKNCKFCPVHNHHKRHKAGSDDDEKHSPNLYGKDIIQNALANDGGGQQLKATQMNIT